MAEKSTIKERILQLAKHKGFVLEEFCSKIELSYGNFKGKSKLTPINSNAIADIFTLIPDVNLEWLITGKGEMLIKVEETQISKDEGVYKELYHEERKKVEELKEEVGKLKEQVVFYKKNQKPFVYDIAAEP